MRNLFCWGGALFAVSWCLVTGLLQGAEVKRIEKSWECDAGSNAKMTEEIASRADWNLLKFPGARLVAAEHVNWPEYLTDDDAGVIGVYGRTMTHGPVGRIVFYLGKPQKISSIRVFSADYDTRCNQDFEVRLANNAEKPGEEPIFSANPSLTSGDVILGPNKGGFMTAFEKEDGSALSEQTYDWVEFRFWQTLGASAGSPAKERNFSSNWCALVEVQVLGNPEDTSLFANDEAKKEWSDRLAAEKRDRDLKKEDASLAYAVKDLDSLRLAIENLVANYPDEYENLDYMARWESFRDRFAAAGYDSESYLALAKEYDAFRREVLLSDPILDFDKVLLRKTKNPALQQNWISNVSRDKGEYDNSLVFMNMKDPEAPLEEIARGRNGSYIGDISLHWEADRCLVTCLSDQKTWQVYECDLTDGSLRQVTPEMGGDVDNVEGCYVPDGSTVFISSASMMGVPCIGGSGPVGNVYRVEADGKTVRQLTFEQDQDWCPTILPNGRIMYLRWEYVDIPHFYARYMFTMNPDGTNQVEHYGSGSFWPNSTFYAKNIPGQSSKFVGIVSGHHGVAREGELVIFDPAKGRQEAQGVVQRIPGRDNPPVNVNIDQLVDGSWPRFLFPCPLDDDHFLVSCRMTPSDPWAIYLVDTFDNMLRLRTEPGYHLLEPFAIIEREEPTLIPDRTTPGVKDSNIFITDVYFGQGLPNVPKGTVKKLRVFAVSYGYRGVGGHDVFGMESCWDGRRILGEVPVFEDGSASFKIPANMPIVLQPLDENGAAVQTMRSWLVGMPGENQSCIGCHETQNDVSPTQTTIARNVPPVDLTGFYGPARPFSFEGEIQPVLDKYCVGCHDGSKKDRPNFADTTPGPRHFSNAYHELHRYVRRPGPESDIHVACPMEYHVSTSELVQMLRKGHHNVQLDDEAWQRLYCWIDLNVPYFGSWTEVVEAGKERGSSPIINISNRHTELKKLYSGNDLNFETDAYYYDEAKKTKVEFVKPAPEEPLDRSAPTVENWPFDAATARKMQSEFVAVNTPAEEGGDFGITLISSNRAKVDLTEGQSFEMVRIPAGTFVMGDENGFNDEFPRSAVTIERPFWLATTETTNALYSLYDALHDSRYIDQWCKDHVLPGYAANEPEQPVIRISWEEANSFCKWLSEKTGKTFRLPTEAEWEWAARAGSAQSAWYGGVTSDFGQFENLSDDSTKRMVVEGMFPSPVPNPPDWLAFLPRADKVDDGAMIPCHVGSYQPNPWGLYDMIGNVAEWTASDYRAYPYIADDGRNAGDLAARKVARGGSWRDRPKWARSGLRRDYESWQKVFNVGFRVLCEDELAK